MYARVSVVSLKNNSCQLISLSIRRDLLLDRDISARHCTKPSIGGSILRHTDDYSFAGRLVCVGVPQGSGLSLGDQ